MIRHTAQKMKQKNGKCQDGSASSMRDIHLHPSCSTLSQGRSIFPVAPHWLPRHQPTGHRPDRPGCAGLLLPLAVGRAGPLQGLLALQAAQALHVQITRLVGQNMASRISSSVVNKIVSPKCSGADKGDREETERVSSSHRE